MTVSSTSFESDVATFNILMSFLEVFAFLVLFVLFVPAVSPCSATVAAGRSSFTAAA